jgi:DNA-binding IclR family transcriptional regulator
MRPDVAGTKDSIFKHLARYPDSKLSCYDLARVLGLSPTTVRRTCEVLFTEAKLWRIEASDGVRYQASPSFIRRLDG